MTAESPLLRTETGSLGSSVKEFKKGVTEASKDESTAAAKKEDEKKA